MFLICAASSPFFRCELFRLICRVHDFLANQIELKLTIEFVPNEVT